MLERHYEETFGDYFRRLRRAAGFKSQKELAKESGISQATLSRIEDGTQKPQKETLTTLAGTLGVSHLKLFEEAGYTTDVYIEKNRSALLDISEKSRENLKAARRELLFEGDFKPEAKEHLSDRIEKYRLPVAPEDFLETMEGLIEELPKRIAEDIDNGDGFYSENENYFKVLDALMIFTEEGRMRFSAIKEKADRRKGELLLILQEEGLTYNGHLLTKEERQHVLDMLAWSFRDKK